MKKLISVALLGLLLSGCTLLKPHKMDIEQGNIITERDVARLHPGMSMSDVKHIMGNPILIHIFSASRLDYVYTMQKGYQPMFEKRVTCLFKQGRLQEVVVT